MERRLPLLVLFFFFWQRITVIGFQYRLVSRYNFCKNISKVSTKYNCNFAVATNEWREAREP